MNKLETVKNKLKTKRGIGSIFSEFEKSVEKQKQAADKFIEAVEDKAVAKVVKSAQGKLLEQSKNLVNDVKKILEENKDGFQAVISYLEYQEKRIKTSSEVSEKVYQNIVSSLKDLAKQTQEVTVTNHPKGITKKQISEAFTNALEEVKNILTGQDEVPGSVSVTYNMQGKVSMIVENYEDYKLTTSIRYTDGKVSSWTTTRG